MSTLKQQKIARRHKRIRARISGTAEKPRISVFRSNRYLYVQLINDEKGETIAAVSSENAKAKTALERASEIGKEIAKLAIAKKIEKAVFDRGGYLYAGKIKAIADGAREGGLKF